MPSLKRLLLCFAIGIASIAHATPTPQDISPAGIWKTVHDETHKERSLVRVTLQHGVLTGVIEKILDPQVPADARCQSCTGSLQGKPLVGMAILSGLAQNKSTPEVWEGGQVLDPNNGKTFKVKLTVAAGGNELHVRGFVGSPLIGRTQIWVRAK